MRFENSISTLEGFSVKNLKRFPSSEWGDYGGLSAEVYWFGSKIMSIYSAGDGGMAKISTTDFFTNTSTILKAKALSLLKRVYIEYTKYDFLKSKEAKDVNEDDWLALVEYIAAGISNYGYAVASFNKGYATVAFLENKESAQKARFRSRSKWNLERVKEYLSETPRFAKYSSLNVVHSLTDFNLTNI